MNKVIILTIDGGGIKGIIPAYFLQELESQLNKSCYEIFDMIGGTSTGGIIATGLTSPIQNGQPFTASEVFNIYQNDGSKIFVSQFSADDYAEYYGDDGNGNGIEPFLQQQFGTPTLSEAQANMQKLGGRTKHVFTTSYTINSNGNAIPNPVIGKDYGPYLFNWKDAANAADDYKVWEAARATSAAPTYFPVANVGGGQNANSNASERWALDGGVMSNNPTVWAVAEAFRTGMAKTLSDIVIISLGTGTYPCGAGLVTADQGGLDPDNGNWGVGPWAVSNLDDLSGNENGRGAIINIITESVQMVSDQQITSMTASGLTYYRLEPTILQDQSKMDNIDQSNIDSLIVTATDYLNGDGQQKFNDIVSLLKTLLPVSVTA